MDWRWKQLVPSVLRSNYLLQRGLVKYVEDLSLRDKNTELVDCDKRRTLGPARKAITGVLRRNALHGRGDRAGAPGSREV